MKGVVDMTHGCRKGEFVCLKANAFGDFEGTKVLPIEFFQRSCSGNIGVQPNQIAGFELDGFVLGIVVFGLKVLRVFDVLNEAFMNFVEIGREFFGGGSGMRWVSG